MTTNKLMDNQRRSRMAASMSTGEHITYTMELEDKFAGIMRENERLRDLIKVIMTPAKPEPYFFNDQEREIICKIQSNKHSDDKDLREEILARICEFEKSGQHERVKYEKQRLVDYDFMAGDQWPKTPD